MGCSTDHEGNGTENPKDSKDIAGNQKSVGESARDFLDDANYGELYVEIQYVQGLEPSTSTLEHFENFLTVRLNKPGGITLELVEIPSPGQETYSIAEIRALEDDLRIAYNQGDTLKVFGLFLDGAYSENTEHGTVLGVAYRNTSFVLFGETIREFSGQPLAPSTTVLESTVLEHEFGHLLGLVNAGTPLQSAHQDTEHGKHCITDQCLMYWTAETGEGLVNMIGGGSIPQLDAACLADLQAHGGK